MTDLTQGALAPVTTPSVYIFQNGKPHAVRVHLDAQGDPLFHVGDLCDLLEHTNARRALSQSYARIWCISWG
jgi:prophage antirepressor-like protein